MKKHKNKMNSQIILAHVLMVGCWTLRHYPCLHCWETLQWQQDGRMNAHERLPLSTRGEICGMGGNLGRRTKKSQCLLN